MRSTASLMILAFLALLVSDARAQETSISLNIEGASGQLQRTPALVIHEVVAPPVIVTSPQAAAKVEQKFEAVEQAVASGQSATLRLDQTELNSYLASHLDIAANAAAKAALTGTSPNDATANVPTPNGTASDPPAPSGTAVEQVDQVRSSVRDVKVELVDDRVQKLAVGSLQPLPSTSSSSSASAATAVVISPSCRTSATSRTRRRIRFATRGVPRERRAISSAASSEIPTPSMPAERCTIVVSSAGS